MSDGHRTDRVYLDPAIERCEPSRHCDQRQACARYLAEVPRMGKIMSNELPPAGYQGRCYYFMSAEAQRGAGPAPAGRRVHESPTGGRL